MKSILTKKHGLLHADQKIGGGNLRDCYSIVNKPGLCVKIVKTKLNPTRKFQAFFFWRNTNIKEYQLYKTIPKKIKPYFNPVIEAEKDYVLTEIPRNYDGSYAMPVKRHKKISNTIFWQHVSDLFHFLEENELWFFDVLNGNNMFVQKHSESDWRPLIVDYKRLGWKAFPWQVYLVFTWGKKKKLRRRYRKFLQKYCAVSS